MPPYSTSPWDCLPQSLLRAGLVVRRSPRRREKKKVSLCPCHRYLYLSLLHKCPGDVWLKGGAFYSWRRCCVAGTYRYCKKFRWCHLSVVQQDGQKELRVVPRALPHLKKQSRTPSAKHWSMTYGDDCHCFVSSAEEKFVSEPKASTIAVEGDSLYCLGCLRS